MRRCSLLLSALVFLSAPSSAHADSPDDRASLAQGEELRALLTKLARHGERVEEMKKRGSYTLSGKLEQLDSEGNPDNIKELVLKITATGAEPSSEVVSYLEDGEDKTEEAKQRAVERAKKTSRRRREFHLPFAEAEQSKYEFTLMGRDVRYPGRVRVGFRAKKPSEDTYDGSAWVHERDGEVESMGFTFSKNPTFVDHVAATLVFGNRTELGRAPSELTFDAKGGFLFIRRHYRGKATLTGATIVPGSKLATPAK